MDMFRGIYLLLMLSWSNCEEGPKVETQYGVLRGQYTQTREGRKVMEFLGIHYAKNPTGKLRFKSPEKPDSWNGVKNATVECDMCISEFVLLESMRYTPSGVEDCLCCNVFTPTVSPSAKLPVLVFIHGGAYIGLTSSKTWYGPEILLDKDMVLVTMSYRQGVLGLLSTEDEVIPGNFAFKDQALALRWVKENIANFGGNPLSITLMGESSGAASTNLHMLSPMSKDLFQRAVVHSGSAYCQWAVAVPGELRSRTARVAELVGCPYTSSAALLSCLQQVPADILVNTTNKFLVWDIDPVVFWKAAVETYNTKDPFLTVDPWKTTTNKPLIIGFNYAEGAFKYLSVTSGSVADKFKQWNDNFDNYMPFSLLYNWTSPNPASITKDVKKYYFESQQIIPSMTYQINAVYADTWFINGVLDAALHNKGPTYLYYFNYNTSDQFSICPILFQNFVYLGACHMDDLTYLYPMNGNGVTKKDPTNERYKLSLSMLDMWFNFIKDASPGQNWQPVKSSAQEFLEINREGFFMKTQPDEDRRKFWLKQKVRS